jgi:putative PIN family toxin of toxin-antitoxin system
VRIVLDTAILVRAHDSANGLARDLLLRLIESDHVLLISNEMLYELAKVLRYPRMLLLHGLSEDRIFDYIGYLRAAAEIIYPNPLLITPIRDANDTVVMQTAIIGEANIICTRDQDFFEPPAEPFLRKAGIEILDDLALMQRLRPAP